MLRIDAAHLVMCLAVASTTVFVQTTLAHAEEGPSQGDAATHLRELSDRDPAIRLAAAQHLGAAVDPATEAALTRTVRNDPVPQVRGWAVRALYQHGTPTALAVVAEAAQSDADERVRALAAQLSVPHDPSHDLATPFERRAAQDDAPETAPTPSQAQTEASQSTPQVEARMVVVVSSTNAAAQPTPTTQTVAAVQPPLSREVLLAARLQIRQERRLRARGIGFITTGWTVLGLSYIGSLTTVAETPISALPVLGSLIAVAQVDNTGSEDISRDEDLVPGLILSSVFQMTGLALAILGHVRRQRGRRALAAQRFAVTPTPNGLAASF